MKKKILFVNDEMTMGGVARILNTFLSLIDLEKYEVDLLLLHKRGELLAEIPSGITILEGTEFFNRVDVPFMEKKDFSKLRLLFYMKTGLIKNKIRKERKKILTKHYDIEFAAKEGFCTIFTAFGDSDIKLNWVQTDYKKNNYAKNHMGLVKEALSYINMNISSSEEAKEAFAEVFGVDNICVIHNLMDENRIRTLSTQEPVIQPDPDKINLICVARFHHQKGLDRLIRVYSRLKDHYTLTIIGDGELKDELYSLSKELGVFDSIRWLGIRQNPYGDIRVCDLFVMPSLYEGYPTISVESLLAGTPVLSTRVAGISEQLLSEECGCIVENSEEALFDKLDEWKDRKDLLQSYKEKLKDYHYDNQKILDLYEQQFEAYGK